ncbi:MAG: glucose-1-phosphate cytidylyltransferase [Elusimicrobia bacterium]|nr:glucose-1-phosphate cytidylyltransferase [Elusimicrobiota bacterium]
MKVVILAGGLGTRISEESHLKPKPMIEIGGKPILWHIMKGFLQQGFGEFVICTGYKGFAIKEYFAHYFLHESDVTFDFASPDKPVIHNNRSERWKVTLVNTGENTMTGGRIKRVASYLDKEPFFMTYGDGVADVDLKKLLDCHRKSGKPATVTATRPLGRFGALELDDLGSVRNFTEKPQGAGWINAGFFVLEPQVLDYIDGDATLFEAEPLSRLSSEGKLGAYRHDGFWQPMDTLRDKNHLESLWASGKAPWKTWKD